jgi:SIR2-like domain
VGHLFVAQGDLTRLACDAIAIPCDADGNVSDFWAGVLPDDLPVGDSRDWRRLDGQPNADGVITLPDNDNRRVRAFVALEYRAEPRDVIDRTWRALENVCSNLEKADSRHLPLVGIPLAGTGAGGLHGRRAEVIEGLLMRQRSSRLHADVALIVRDRRDFAAVQVRRRADTDWPDLDAALAADADRLGALAGSRQLSLFLGAGVSTPVGLPNWWQLLEKLAERAGVVLSRDSEKFEDAATPIVAALGDDYHPAMTELLNSKRHAVGHALLANLRVKQMVTTNFDPCMELALEPVLKGDFRVLARQLADGAKPWLLKLNGDVRQPGSMALARTHFDERRERTAALGGVVESLLLTSHMLFVGFSLTDESFLEMAAAVTLARALALDGEDTPTGTAVALTPTSVSQARYTKLHMISMLDDGSQVEAARKLEIFLDRLGWAAASKHELSAEYLLDERYATGLSPQERALRDVLRLVENASSDAKASPGWSRVADCLRDLGAQPAH